MKHLFALTAVYVAGVVATVIAGDHTKFDFRSTPECAALSAEKREKLEQVDRDFSQLSAEISKYADDHGGRNPTSLDALVPKYLRKLPKDPFATASTAAEKPAYGWRKSLDGRGYQCTPDDPMFFHVASAGLPGFPYLCEQNYGLYRGVRQQPPRFVAPESQRIQEEDEPKLGLGGAKAGSKQ
jgi:hypothetical protein